MKGIQKNTTRYFVLFFVLIFLLVLSACGGVAPDDGSPGTDLPTISSFTATSTSITEGGNVTLIWVTNDATTVYLKQQSESGVVTGTVGPSGSQTFSPSETTTYTLTATNDVGSTPAIVTVTVNPAAVITQTIPIQPGPEEGKESYIYVGYPDDNYGSTDWVMIGHIVTWGSFRAYLQFNLSDLPAGAVITNAVLKLYWYDYGTSSGSPQDFDIGVYRVNGPWEEDTITWNTRPGYKPTPESTFFMNLINPETWMSWNVTSLVQGWKNGSIPNYGLVLRDTDETTGNVHIRCYSSDYTGNNTLRPKLELTYNLP
jgi:hypothetical protein